MKKNNVDIFLQNEPRDGFLVMDNIKSPIDFGVNQPYIINGLLIALVEYGESKLTINFEEYQTCKNTVLVIHNHSIIEILELARDRRVKAFFMFENLFSDETFFKKNKVPAKFSKHFMFTVDDSSMRDLLYFYDFIINQQTNTNIQYQADMNKYLAFSFCLKVKSIYDNLNIINTNMQESRNKTIVDNFFLLVYKHCIEERKVSFYADKLCISPKYLSATVKKVLGQPCLHWINQMLISQAKFKLKTSETSVNEISDQLNFMSPSQFGRFFKQHTGLTPLQYRLM